MKRLLILFIPLVFFFGCEKNNPDKEYSTGYNCVETISNDGALISYDCVAEEGGQYNTLEDCQNSQSNCNGWTNCEICIYTFLWEDFDWAESNPIAYDIMDVIMELFDSMASGELCGDDLIAAKDAFTDLDDDQKYGDEVMDDPTTAANEYVSAWGVTMSCVASE